MFAVKITPILENSDKNKKLCNIIEPDVVHVTIDDTIEDSEFENFFFLKKIKLSFKIAFN